MPLSTTPPIVAAELWERARRSERGIAIFLSSEAALFKAKMGLYQQRRRDRRRNDGVSLYDFFSIQTKDHGPDAPPEERYQLSILPVGVGEIPLSTKVIEL